MDLGQLRRYRVSFDTAWRFEPLDDVAFPTPDATKGIGTVQLLADDNGGFPHMLFGDNDWRQTTPVPPEWAPDLPFSADMRVRYQGVNGRDAASWAASL